LGSPGTIAQFAQRALRTTAHGSVQGVGGSRTHGSPPLERTLTITKCREIAPISSPYGTRTRRTSLRVFQLGAISAGDIGRLGIMVLGMAANTELEFIRDCQYDGVDEAMNKDVHMGLQKRVDD